VAAQSTVGCEYYARVTAEVGCYAAIVVNTWSTPITIQVDADGTPLDVASLARIPTGSGQAITYTPLPGGQLPPQSVALVFLSLAPTGPGCPAGVVPAHWPTATFHITTSAPAVAYDMDPYGGGASEVTSASLLLPTSAWDTNYVAVAPWPSGFNVTKPRLTITAAEDATQVTINPKITLLPGTIGGQSVPGSNAGVAASYTLGKGQSLVFEQTAELTGSAIQSTKPVGVLGSQVCIAVDACCCDSAHQPIPPVRALGSEYAAVRYRDRIDGMDEAPPWRIVGAVDGTILTYDPQAPTMAPLTLDSGQVATFSAGDPFVVRSQDESHPFYLAGYMTGGAPLNDVGDSEFVNVVPPLQYLPYYVFFTDPTYPETDLVLVRQRASDMTFKDVTLDCAGVLGGWQPIGASDYQYTRTDLVRHDFQKQGNCDNGRHVIKSDAPFGLTVWGWGTHETDPTFVSTYASYAYPAGENVRPINAVVVTTQ
jgi:hypothetical protein